MSYVGLGRDNLRSHFVFRPRHAPEWLRARFLPVVFLANEEELTGKTFTTSLNTTNPNTCVKFIFLRTSPLTWVLSHCLLWLGGALIYEDIDNVRVVFVRSFFFLSSCIHWSLANKKKCRGRPYHFSNTHSSWATNHTLVWSIAG